jgi:hypothetical protein
MLATTFINSTLALYTDKELSWIQELFLSTGYIADDDGTPTFQIEQNTTPAHNVIVKAGHLLADFTKGGKTWKVKVQNDADTVLSVPQNVSGSTKYAHIVVKVDNTIEPNIAKSNIASLVVVSLATATPTAGDIQAVIGASQDFYHLGYVTQVNSNPVITTAIITNISTKAAANSAIDIPHTTILYPDGYFADSAFPSSPFVGQWFFKTGDGMYYWDGSSWVKPLTTSDIPLTTAVPAVAGEAITVSNSNSPVPVAVDTGGTAAVSNIVGSTASGGTNARMDSVLKWQGQNLIIPAGFNRITEAKFKTNVSGTPDGTLEARIYALDGSNKPTGAALGTSNPSVNLNTFSAGLHDVDLTFATPVTVTEGTKYGIVLRHNNDGSTNLTAGNFIEVIVAGTDTLPEKITTTDNSVTWTATTNNDLAIMLSGKFESSGAGRIIRASAADPKRYQFIGFINTSVADGATVSVINGGSLAKTGLSAGASVYVTSAGTLSATAGSVKIRAGYINSTADKLIMRPQSQESIL